jgi:hypothetical protein
MDMIAKIYGEIECLHFKYAWVPLAYIMVITGSLFNWVSILSYQLNMMFKRAYKAKEKP